MSEEPVPCERLDEYVTPLETTDPDADLTDLAPVADRVADATVLAMGEATHGTREFFQLKHRVFRHLVEEHGWRLFGLEANFAETLALNDYVVDGEGDPEDALDGIYFWTWNTEEVLAMVEWMREFNAGRPRPDRIRFYGVDAQFPQGPARALREFFAEVDPAFLDAVGDDLERFTEDGFLQDQRSVDGDDLALAEEVVDDLNEWFDAHGGTDEAETEDAAEVALARQHFRTLEQVVDLKREMYEADDPATGYDVRDEYMAENVAWILDHEDRDRIALWAHNGHVFRGTTTGVWDKDPTGSYLADRFGDDYAVLGFDFDHGSFRAVGNPEEVDDPELETWTVDPLVDVVPLEPGESDDGDDGDSETAEGSSDEGDTANRTPPAVEYHAALRELDADAETLFVDVTAARNDENLGEWIDRPHLCHHLGAVFHDQTDPQYYERYRLGREMDGLLFVRSSSRARPVDDETDD